jgi:hypothetical protein
MGANTAYLHLENYDLPEVFLSKLIQFSPGSNVLDANASDTDDFLWRDICVSSTQLNGSIRNKMSLSPP